MQLKNEKDQNDEKDLEIRNIVEQSQNYKD